MKTTSSYFPFVIISLVLYGFVFIYIDQPQSIPTLPLNSGEQAIQVQFIALPNATEDNLTQPSGQETVVETIPEVADVQEKKTIKYNTKSLMISESEVKLKEQALLESIAEADTDSVATLKAAVFNQQQVTDEIIANEAEQPNKTKTNSSAVKKMVVKKRPSENSPSTSSTTNQGVLQEAIVVSGRKPFYPQLAILRNQQGRVVVQLTVTKKGQPKNPKILTSSGFSLLDDAVLTFINQELFMPALQGEDKVSSEQLFSFRFELN